MKRMFFLNGTSVIFALAAVALATTFTSCENEQFNVSVESNPAKVIFNPNVIDATTSSNVTAHATFTGNEEIVSTKSDKSLDAGKVIITATFKKTTGSIEVSYPAVAAGQLVSISPVIILSPGFKFEAIEESVQPIGSASTMYGNAPNGVNHDGKIWAENPTAYFRPFVAAWNNTATITRLDDQIQYPQTKNVTIISPTELLQGSAKLLSGASSPYNAAFHIQAADVAAQVTHQKLFADTIKAPSKFQLQQIGNVTLFASAYSMYNATFLIQPAIVIYQVTNQKSLADTILGSYYNPAYMTTATIAEVALPGFEAKYVHGGGVETAIDRNRDTIKCINHYFDNTDTIPQRLIFLTNEKKPVSVLKK